MKYVPASCSGGITETKRSSSAMPERLNADLQNAIQEGIDSGPIIPAENVFAELNARYAETA